MITLASPRKLVKCAKKFFPALSPSVYVQGTLSAFMSFLLADCLSALSIWRSENHSWRRPRTGEYRSVFQTIPWFLGSAERIQVSVFFFQLSFFTCLEEIFVRRSGAAQFLNSNCYGKRNITLDVEFTKIFIRGDFSKLELIEVESAKLYNNWVIKYYQLSW